MQDMIYRTDILIFIQPIKGEAWSLCAHFVVAIANQADAYKIPKEAELSFSKNAKTLLNLILKLIFIFSIQITLANLEVTNPLKN